MQDKIVLGEFAAKISKAKILHDSTQAICLKLRREAAQLQKQYNSLRNQRQSAEVMEKSLKSQLQMTQKANQQENEKCKREEHQLADLRQNKKALKREKDIEHHQLLKNTLQLQQLVKKREQLEHTAKQLSDKLEGVTSQKQLLQEEYVKTQAAIKKYNVNIRDLEQEIQEMRQVITKNTVPVFNISQSSVSQHQP